MPRSILCYGLGNSWNDRFQQANELALNALGSLQHLDMVERLIEDSCGGIRYAGDTQHANAAVPRGDYFRNRGHADEVCANRVQVAYLGGRFVARPKERCVHSFVHPNAQAVCFVDGHFTKALVVGRGHVVEAQAEAVIVRAGERIDALQIDVIADDHETALREFAFDATGGVGEDHGFHTHTREDADGKRNLLRRIAFVKMYAALHARDGNSSDFTDYELSSVPDGRRLGKMRNFCVRNFRGAGKFIGECAKPGAKNECNPRPKRCLRKNEVGGFTRAFELAIRAVGGGLSGDFPRRHGFRSFPLGAFLCAHERIPTMEADIRFAMVPASMARMPNLASWLRCSGASAPMPPIWIPMELKLAKPQRAKVAMAKVRGSSVPFMGPSWPNATNSLITMRVPSRLPIFAASCQGTPISHATGAKIQPKTVCRLSGNQAM